MNKGQTVLRMLGSIISVFIVLMMTACSAGSYRNQVDNEYYILDVDKGLLCIEKKAKCHRLSLIGPSYREHIIAQGFGLPNNAYRWGEEQLIELLLNPPNAQYRPEKLSNTIYRIPPHFSTHSVWDVLALEQYDLYERGDDWFGGFELMPIPRRY